jgi:hypothetical protein
MEATGCSKTLVTIDQMPLHIRRHSSSKKYLVLGRFCDKIELGTMTTNIYTETSKNYITFMSDHTPGKSAASPLLAGHITATVHMLTPSLPAETWLKTL